MLVQHAYRGIFIVFSRWVNKYVLYKLPFHYQAPSCFLQNSGLLLFHMKPRGLEPQLIPALTSQIAEMSERIVDVEDEEEITDGFV